MTDHEDIRGMQDRLRDLSADIKEMLATTTKKQWKDTYIEEIDDFVKVRTLLDDLGYGEEE